MNNPKVSVVVPIYNAAVFLPATIQSIQEQAYTNLEIILVNDCSTDQSLDVCRRFSVNDKRIIVVDKKVNEGEDYARFSGIESATGDYFVFLDADDWFRKDAVEFLVATALNNNVDIVYANNIRVYSSRFHITSFKEFDKRYINRVISGDEKKELFISFFGVNIIPVTMWGNIFKRELFIPTPKKSGLKFGADLALSMQLYHNANSIYMTSVPVLNYRWGGVTAGFQPKFLECVKALYLKKVEFLNSIYYPQGERTAKIELVNCLATHILSLVTYFPKDKNSNMSSVKNEMGDCIYSCFKSIQTDSYFKVGSLNEACVRLDYERALDIAYCIASKPTSKMKLLIKKLALSMLKHIKL